MQRAGLIPDGDNKFIPSTKRPDRFGGQQISLRSCQRPMRLHFAITKTS